MDKWFTSSPFRKKKEKSTPLFVKENPITRRGWKNSIEGKNIHVFFGINESHKERKLIWYSSILGMLIFMGIFYS